MTVCLVGNAPDVPADEAVTMLFDADGNSVALGLSSDHFESFSVRIENEAEDGRRAARAAAVFAKAGKWESRTEAVLLRPGSFQCISGKIS